MECLTLVLLSGFALVLAIGRLLLVEQDLLPPPTTKPEPPRSNLAAQDRLQAYALGLHPVLPHRWTGSRDGISLIVEPPSVRVSQWRVQARLPFVAPPGLFIEADLHGIPITDNADAKALAVGLADVLQPIVRRGWRCEITSRVAVVARLEDRDEVAKVIDAAVAVAKALQARQRTLCQPVLDHLGLDALPAHGAAAEGTVDGRRVRFDPPGRGHWHTQAVVWLRHPLPPGTVLRPKEADDTTSDEVGDIMIDTALRIDCSAPDALRSRLAHDAVRGPLLDLICTFPPSRVLADRVIHVVHDGAIDQGGALLRAWELAAALDATAGG